MRFEDMKPSNEKEKAMKAKDTVMKDGALKRIRNAWKRWNDRAWLDDLEGYAREHSPIKDEGHGFNLDDFFAWVLIGLIAMFIISIALAIYWSITA